METFIPFRDFDEHVFLHYWRLILRTNARPASFPRSVADAGIAVEADISQRLITLSSFCFLPIRSVPVVVGVTLRVTEAGVLMA